MIIAFRDISTIIRCIQIEPLGTFNVLRCRWDVKDHVVALLRHGVKESRNRVFRKELFKRTDSHKKIGLPITSACTIQ